MPKDIRCPVCNSTTVVRTAKKDPDTGRKFHVCTRYPECKGRIKARKGVLRRLYNYKLIIPVILLMIVIFSIVGLILGFNVKVTEEPINNMLNAVFPITRSVGGSMNITLDNAKVDLTKGEDVILVSVDVYVNLKTGETERTIEGDAIIRSEIYYDRGYWEVFLKNSELLNLDIADIDISVRKPLFSTANAAVGTVLNTYPIYKLKVNNILYTIAVSFLRDISVEDGFVSIRIGF
jgi:ssDNA-binding Zn-finger/Zn-ribbon topoisomerase 1